MQQPLKILGDYYLLPTGMNAERVHELLGRVVEYPVQPLVRYEPEDKIIPQKLVEGLMGNSNALESVTEKSHKNETDKGRIRVTDLVRAHVNEEEGTSAAVAVYLLKTYDMTQIKPNFDKLKEDPAYLAGIEKIFDETKKTKLPMITKVLVCEDMEVKEASHSNSGIGVGAKLPVTAAATHGAVIKGPLDVDAEFEHEKKIHDEKTKKIKGKIIVALAYTWVERSQVPKKRQPRETSLFKRIKAFFSHKDDSPKMEINVCLDPNEPPYMSVETKDRPEQAPEKFVAEGKRLDIEEGSSSEHTAHDDEDENHLQQVREIPGK
ncbi:hypothetical protein G7Y89_g4014 [Cudoniella acicularis]|uniref:Uncharacterized protein n=1 Tax=Cudoniella acicularis TaxID=354080 RepID=A0A8H4RSC5_9HELO|nr:hypothetical protein G7Y89_g4014 [Cudoniella acicularis]